MLSPAWDNNTEIGLTYIIDIANMYDRVLITWNYSGYCIQMQMIDADGSLLGQKITIESQQQPIYLPQIAKIDHENAYIAWFDNRAANFSDNCVESFQGIYMQKLSTAGFTPIYDQNIPQKSLTLYQNYPNPFNPSTSIAFTLKNTDRVKLAVYNVKGQKVVDLADNVLEQGNHTITWNGKDMNGKNVGSGIYYYQIKAGQYTETRKMLLMK